MHSDQGPSRLTRLRTSEVAEGVISTAIAVLVMAFIGAAMWVTFNRVFEGAAENVETEVGRIGSA
jgi:uncharacterized membrane protein (DUF485 family)